MIDSRSEDEEIIAFLARVKDGAARDAPLAADLASTFAASGHTYDPNTALTADVASSGGPSSLSTLLCPLFLRAGGLVVPKLGVPGRPAGGIDCLAQVEGYRTQLDDSSLDAALTQAGYAHFLAAGRYAPLDARVFKLRQTHGFQGVPTLVAASLLSKKLAVGVKSAGLDVRVAMHGNFGRTWEEARANAALFASAARLHGIRAFPVLTDAAFPYQPFIGRSEALLALANLFDSKAHAWLESHLNLCRQLSLAAAPVQVRASISDAGISDLKSHFIKNLEAQGASEEGFLKAVRICEAGHTHVVRASESGFASYSLEQIRRTFVRYQESASTGAAGFSDPLGLILLRRPGEWVASGELLATARVDSSLDAAQVLRELESAVARQSRSPLGQNIEGFDDHE